MIVVGVDTVFGFRYLETVLFVLDISMQCLMLVLSVWCMISDI